MFSRVLASLVLAGSLGLASLTTARADDTGKVTVIHGVPDLTVDVYVNDELTLESFAPKTVTDPIELPAGDYDIAIYPADADPASGDPAISGSVTLPAGADASVIAHLGADGTPMLSAFVNDVSDIAAGNTRVVVRHTAAAPAVDVLANGNVLVPGLANPDSAAADVPAGSYAVSLAPAGTSDIVFGPVDLDLKAGTEYIVYATGDIAAGSFDLVLQTIDGLGAAPTNVPSGNAGLVDESGAQAWMLVAAAVAMLTLTVSGSVLVRSRTRN